MKSIWAILWVILLLCQVVTVWISRQMLGDLELPPADLDRQLLDLANDTNEFLLDRAACENDPGNTVTVSRNESLMRRESLILELRELQNAILSEGVEMEIIEDIQAYLKTLDGSESVTTINAYIAGLIGWLQPHSSGEAACRLERVSLYPARLTDFPVLAFEMSGVPQTMGERLLAGTDMGSRWNLDELDLVMNENGSAYWLRGSCTFSQSLNPHAE